MLKFRKVTSSKYVSSDDYEIHQLKDSSFAIVKNNHVATWGCNFQSIRAAETFLNKHDYINATSSFIPMNNEDVDLIYDMYCSSGSRSFGSKWYITSDFWIQGGLGYVPDTNLKFIQFNCSDGTCYNNADDLVEKIDSITNVFCNKLYARDINSAVLAKQNMKSQNRGLRPQDLMRVKSSNVWAIGVEVSDDNHRMGTVYVQFKGKNGGPGDAYRYYDVPLTLYRKMTSAPSFGHFVWKYLRNNFQYSKLTGDKRGKLRNAIN